MTQVLLMLWMFVVGSLIAVQGAANSALNRFLEQPLHAAIVSFATGLLALLAIGAVLPAGWPSFWKVAEAPKLYLIGGVLGALFIITVILVLPRIGAGRTTVASLCGQVVLSLVIDHVGLLGVPQQPIDAKRLVAAGLVIAGVVLFGTSKG